MSNTSNIIIKKDLGRLHGVVTAWYARTKVVHVKSKKNVDYRATGVLGGRFRLETVTSEACVLEFDA